jgi:hypothetical protein
LGSRRGGLRLPGGLAFHVDDIDAFAVWVQALTFGTQVGDDLFDARILEGKLRAFWKESLGMRISSFSRILSLGRAVLRSPAIAIGIARIRVRTIVRVIIVVPPLLRHNKK